MKNTVIAATLLCLAVGFSAPSFAADPCEIVLCLYGKATGNSGGSRDCDVESGLLFVMHLRQNHETDCQENGGTLERSVLAAPNVMPVSSSETPQSREATLMSSARSGIFAIAGEPRVSPSLSGP
ncbi:hypothetical protein EDC48_101300 [Gibbsiella quercinecans]|nr:hypothetical protein EDC48_101300 [Gibbsiella quercinecans]